MCVCAEPLPFLQNAYRIRRTYFPIILVRKQVGNVQLFYVWPIEMKTTWGNVTSSERDCSSLLLLLLLQCFTDTYILRVGVINYIGLFLVIITDNAFDVLRTLRFLLLGTALYHTGR